MDHSSFNDTQVFLFLFSCRLLVLQHYLISTFIFLYCRLPHPHAPSPATTLSCNPQHSSAHHSLPLVSAILILQYPRKPLSKNEDQKEPNQVLWVQPDPSVPTSLQSPQVSPRTHYLADPVRPPKPTSPSLNNSPAGFSSSQVLTPSITTSSIATSVSANAPGIAIMLGWLYRETPDPIEFRRKLMIYKYMGQNLIREVWLNSHPTIAARLGRREVAKSHEAEICERI